MNMRARSSFCDPIGKMGFCSPPDEGQNCAAPFTERAPKGEGMSWERKRGGRCLERNPCWDG